MRLSVTCLSKPLLMSPVGGSGDQYEAPVFAGSASVALDAVFLAVEALRGLVMPLLCTRVAFGAAVCSGALMVGMEPSRADRRRDILRFGVKVNVLYSIESTRAFHRVLHGGSAADETELRPRISN